MGKLSIFADLVSFDYPLCQRRGIFDANFYTF